MASSLYVIFLLVATFGPCAIGQQTMVVVGPIEVMVTNECVSDVTVAEQTECRDMLQQLIQDNTQNTTAGLVTIITIALVPDPCQDGTEQCAGGCTFNNDKSSDAYGQISCSCPDDDIRYEDALNSSFVQGKTCRDIDECQINTDTCDDLGATCTNLNGSFNCSCNPGLIDAGTQPGELCVTAENECIVPTAPICSENAECSTLERYLGCFSSFGNPTTSPIRNSSQDCINTCSNDANAKFALLSGLESRCLCATSLPTNTPSSGCVTCPVGNDTCGGNFLTSIYRLGPYHDCTCKNGYTGNGTHCFNVNECMDNSSCPSGAQCMDTEGSFQCTCLTGKIKLVNGSCAEPAAIKECNNETEETDQKLEVWGPNCQVVYLLPCNYTGNDYEGEGERMVIDLGNLGPSTTCIGNRLVNTLSPEFTNERQKFLDEGGESLLGARVTCTETQISITIDRYVANQIGFFLADLHLEGSDSASTTTSDPSCRGQIWYEQGAQYRFTTGIDTQCGTVHTYNNAAKTQITLTNVIRGGKGMFGGDITRHIRFKVEFSCTYNISTQQVSRQMINVYDLGRRKRSLHSLPAIQKRQVSVTRHIAVDGFHLGVDLSLWNDASFRTHLDQSKVVQASEKIHLQLSTLWFEQNRFEMRILRCWMSPAALEDKRTKNIISNGCSRGPSKNKDTTIISIDQSKIHINFHAASFDGGFEEINIQCLVDLCDSKSVSNCQKRCSDIASPSDGKTVKLDARTLLLSSGPIKVHNACGGKKRGGCQHFCAVSSDQKPVCTCLNGFEIDKKDPTRCIGAGQTVYSTPLPVYYFILPIIALLLLIVALIMYAKIRKKGKSASYKFPEIDDTDDTRQFDL